VRGTPKRIGVKVNLGVAELFGEWEPNVRRSRERLVAGQGNAFRPGPLAQCLDRLRCSPIHRLRRPKSFATPTFTPP
jgi:hypothetical protein